MYKYFCCSPDDLTYLKHKCEDVEDPGSPGALIALSFATWVLFCSLNNGKVKFPPVKSFIMASNNSGDLKSHYWAICYLF